MSPTLELRDISVTRGDRTILNVEHLAVHSGEVLTVIGPNGAGKSTLLMLMARLLWPDTGQLSLNGQAIEHRDDLDYRRRIGLVLQDPLLFHGSVLDNVCMGLKFRGWTKRDRQEQANTWLERLGISHLSNRQVSNLSGGESQRVSLARSFALDPDLLLLDEPFSALDSPTRSRLLSEFQALLVDTKMTTVFVTHDMEEALHVSDRVAVILDGRLRQVDTPQQVFTEPADPDVAAFVGLETTIAGEVVESENGQVTVDVGRKRIEAVAELQVGRRVLICLKPEDVTLWADKTLPPSSALNQMTGVIGKMTLQKPLVHVVIDCGFPVHAFITQLSASSMALVPGTSITITFKASAVHLIPR